MLALYISLLDTEEQISKFEHIYTKYRGIMFYTAKGSCKILILQKMLSMKPFWIEYGL